ncbi:MAG: DUF3127 domain-containing protein [Prevotellaceae bacterium]|jgi:hypothetical protein|nr:DUF3127 domain-containing protein [Prevotellaceae bacterium]
MEINGTIIQLQPLQTGEGRNGLWKKQDYILQTNEQYPKKICFNFWGDKIDQFNLQVGDNIKLSFDIESREFNGRWYTDVRGWKAEKEGSSAAPAPEAYNAQGSMPPPPPPPAADSFPFGSPNDNSDNGNDLPF